MHQKPGPRPKEPWFLKVMWLTTLGAVFVFPALFTLLFGRQFAGVGMLAAAGLFAITFFATSAYNRSKGGKRS